MGKKKTKKSATMKPPKNGGIGRPAQEKKTEKKKKG